MLGQLTKRDKRTRRFINNPLGHSWDESAAVLRRCGFTVDPPSDGSHWAVYHEEYGDMTQTVPVHDGQVKPFYAKKLARWVADISSQGEGKGGPEY